MFSLGVNKEYSIIAEATFRPSKVNTAVLSEVVPISIASINSAILTSVKSKGWEHPRLPAWMATLFQKGCHCS